MVSSYGDSFVCSIKILMAVCYFLTEVVEENEASDDEDQNDGESFDRNHDTQSSHEIEVADDSDSSWDQDSQRKLLLKKPFHL